MLCWGIIGAGVIADVRMAPAIREATGCELVAVQARDAAKAAAFAARHGVARHYTDVAALVADPQVDAVYIASPNVLHAEQTILAAQHGKQVLCEKPMALTLEECQAMVDACRAHGVQLMIGFMMRFHAAHQQARAMVKSGFLGEPKLARAHFLFQLPQPGPDNWRQQPSLSGGGAVMDVAVHCVDVLRFLLGREVEAVSAFADHDPATYPSDETTVILLRFEGNVQGAVEVSFGVPYASNDFALYGSQGTLLGTDTLGQEPTGSLRALSAAGVSDLPLRPVNMYVAEVEHFARCIAEGREPATSGEEGWQVQRIALAIYEAICCGSVSSSASKQ
jgi:1,5-anhydro-D-fructose reductase (1,5-anhydro-D-mannitol-forming)